MPSARRAELLGADRDRVIALVDEQTALPSRRKASGRRRTRARWLCRPRRAGRPRAASNRPRGGSSLASRQALACVGPGDVQLLTRGERLQLGGVDAGGGAAVGDEHVGGDLRVGVRGAMAQHRHQRDQPGAAADQVERAALVDRPRERPSDRSADLELVASDDVVDEVGRDLAVLEALDRQLDGVVLPAPMRSSTSATPGSRPRRSGARRRAGRRGGRPAAPRSMLGAR